MRRRDPRFTFPQGTPPRLYRGVITAPFIALRREPKPAASIDTELLYGQEFDVHAEFKTALLGRVRPIIASRRRAYVGYVPRKAVSQKVFTPTHCVSVVSAPVFARADIKSRVKAVLPMNARMAISPGAGPLHKVAGLGYLHDQHIRAIDTAESDFVSAAEQFLGRPYIWGGTGGVGVDCSGLVQMALAATGIDAPRDADQQEAYLGDEVSGDLMRGDLVFWPGHVGIMESGTRLLHANAHHMATAREPLKKAIQRIGPPRIIKRL